MSDITDRELQTLSNWGNELEERAADEIERLQVEYDHAVEQAAKNADEVLALREQLTLAETVRASQVAGLVEGAEKLREEVKRLTKIIDDAWGEA